MPRPKWTLNEAVAFLTDLAGHLEPCGMGVGLMGSVLTKGESRKDLDVILYPMDSSKPYPWEVTSSALKGYGLELLVDTDSVHQRWRKLGSQDEKIVQIWSYKGRRVDVFFLKG